MEKSPAYIELACPANLKISTLLRNASPQTIFANTTVNPAKFDAEKRKWAKSIRIKKFYKIFNKIIAAMDKGHCDDDGFAYFQSPDLEKALGSTYARTCRIILENLKVIECRFRRHSYWGFCGMWIMVLEFYLNRADVPDVPSSFLSGRKVCLREDVSLPRRGSCVSHPHPKQPRLLS